MSQHNRPCERRCNCFKRRNKKKIVVTPTSSSPRRGATTNTHTTRSITSLTAISTTSASDTVDHDHDTDNDNDNSSIVSMSNAIDNSAIDPTAPSPGGKLPTNTVAGGGAMALCTRCIKRGIAPALWQTKPLRSAIAVICFVVVAGVCGYCCSNLQPATGIPSIFADDNNIQIYLSSLALFTGTTADSVRTSFVASPESDSIGKQYTSSFGYLVEHFLDSLDTSLQSITVHHYVGSGTRYCYDCAAKYHIESFCDNVDCGSHGTCAAGLCQCDPSYSGTTCDTGPCSDVDCSQRGTCSEGLCTCDFGYSGYNCQVKL